jgi:FdhD protein
LPALAERTARRTVTSGCGQGTVFGALLQDSDALRLPAPVQPTLSQGGLYAMLEQVRGIDSVYKKSGSVHGCALFVDGQLRCHVEDVGRHNAIDTIAGWLWMQGIAEGPGEGSVVFYTTGRLTSEMVMKAAAMRVPVLVSRNGVTQMGQEMAQRLGLCLIARAKGWHFLVCSGFAHFASEPLALQTS